MSETWKHHIVGDHTAVIVTEDGYTIVDDGLTQTQAKVVVAAHNAAVRRLEWKAAQAGEPEPAPRFPDFGAYACIGDTVQMDAGHMRLVAKLHYDGDSTPDDVENFDPAQKQRWLDDEWFYAGVVLSVWVGDQLIADDVASLWGVEVNLDDNQHVTDVANDLIPAALTVGRLKVGNLIESLKAVLA